MENSLGNKKDVLTIVTTILIVVVIGKITSILNPPHKKSITVSPSKQIMEIRVRPGWCLSRIAEDLGTNTEYLVEINQIKDPNFIHANEILKVDPYNKIKQVKVSWYGSVFHGKKMSNGKTFDMYDNMTAAHKLLPFNTRVKLTRIDNQKSIIVIIRDRGPYIKGRHFDLSYAAAKELGIVELGVVICRVEILN